MEFKAKAKFLPFSPYKLRPLADVVRGKHVDYALSWLTTYAGRRVSPLKKVIESARANAKMLGSVQTETLVIKDIRVDEGPQFKYFKPAAMGRSQIQRRRMSHISVVLEERKQLATQVRG